MSEPYLGEIRIFPWDWAPRGWAACDGSKMDIWQYQALYAVIGQVYGGDGQTYFTLPDMRGKAPMNWGTSTVPGISAYPFNSTGGTATVTLNTTQMPNHNHNATVVSALGTTAVAASNLYFGFLNVTNTQTYFPYKAPAAGLATVPLNGQTLTTSGSNNPVHNNQQPFLALNFCIALEGTWPMRQD